MKPEALPTERTLVLIKPDAIQRGLSGKILARFERKGLKIIGLKMMHLKDAILREHYAHVVDRPFFAELSEFMSSAPVFAVCLEGHNAIDWVRKISGTSPEEFGTIRGDFSVSCQKNLIHSSDSTETASREIVRFFEPDELFEYPKESWRQMYSECDA